MWLDEVDSTNEDAKRRASAGTAGPIWIAARQQTAGRGRAGRSWVSPLGNLYATALFPFERALADAVRLPFAAGLAVVDAIERLAPSGEPRLKWPNDVRVGGAKIAGVLVESGETPGASRWIALGIGLNVRFAPEDAGQAATSITDLRGDDAVRPEIALDALRETWPPRLNQALADFPATLADWRDRAEGLGAKVSVNAPEGLLSGVFEDLAADGALILRLANGERRIIRAGDVALVREVD